MRASNSREDHPATSTFLLLDQAIARSSYLRSRCFSGQKMESEEHHAGHSQNLRDEWCDSHPNLVEAALSILSVSSPLMLLGEPGLEPHRFAQWLHGQSSGASHPFVRIHATGVRSGKLQYLLKIGSWVEAAQLDQESSDGWLAAQGGTLFVDEWMDLPPYLQHRLENWIKSGRWETLDGTQYVLDARLIAATQAQPQDCARQNPEIYYEMTRGALRLPPLREEVALLPRLLHAANQNAAEQLGIPPSPINTQAIEFLAAYAWPGNLAELWRVALYANSHRQYELVTSDSLPPYLRQLARSYHSSRFASYRRRAHFPTTH